MSNLIDGVFALLLFVVFAIAGLAAFLVFDSLDDASFFGSMSAPIRGFFTSVNNTSVFIAIAVAAVPVISALFIRTHPIFFIVSLIFLFAQFIITPTFVNMFNAVAQQMPTDVQNGLSSQIQIIQFLPLLSLIGTLIAMLLGLVNT